MWALASLDVLTVRVLVWQTLPRKRLLSTLSYNEFPLKAHSNAVMTLVLDHVTNRSSIRRGRLTGSMGERL